MALLTIGGVDIPVDMNELPEVEVQVIEFGDRGRADDGTELSDIIATKEEVALVTRPLTAAEATNVYNALTATPPLTTAGDLFGALSVTAQITARIIVTLPGGRRTRYAFTLREV